MICYRCHKDLPEDAFAINRTRSRGRACYCRKCSRDDREHRKREIQEHPEKFTHGRYATYIYGCRCPACRRGYASARKKYRIATINAETR